jgi:hypothetical protein
MSPKEPKGDPSSLYEIAMSIGRMDEKLIGIALLIEKSATKESMHALKEDVDGVAALMRENQAIISARLDQQGLRISALENTQTKLQSEQTSQGTTLKNLLDIVFKIVAAGMIALLGWDKFTR